MRRLCLLIPDIATTKRIAEHVREHGVTDGHIHVLGKSPMAIEHLHLHRANLFQTTNLLNSLIRGGIAGCTVGMLLGFGFLWIAPWGMAIPGSGVVIFALVGTLLGLWISGLVGIAVQNPVVEQASLSIQEGKYLMMIDLSQDQEEVMTGEIMQKFPQAKLASAVLH